jgi:arsenite methyltransferase
MTEDIREHVRDRYARAARAVRSSPGPVADPYFDPNGCGCGPSGYSAEEVAGLPREVLDGSLGCGNPVAVADLRPGEVVLDLGSGGGLDVLLSARRVGPDGKVYGLDMTDEMLELSRENRRRAGVANAQFLRGHMEDVPLPDGTVDIVLSNCVVNLSPDKDAVFAEVYRVLKDGGRVAIYDIVADRPVDPEQRADPEAWSACLSGALTRDEFRAGLTGAGLQDVSFTESHQAAPGFSSVVVRAVKPGREDPRR